jgi:hypothetical protein
MGGAFLEPPPWVNFIGALVEQARKDKYKK